MRLTLRNIDIENFLSIGRASVQLEDRGYCLITGVNNNPNDNTRSNGSGKSSILDAIAWVITGETIRGVKDVVNMFGTGDAIVTLDFSVDEDNYQLVRTKGNKTDLKIYKNGLDISGKGIRDSQKLLEEYLPDLTSSLLGSVILLGQGLPQRFSNNTPAGRKEVLEKLSKSDFMIEDLKRRLSERKFFLNGELRVIEDRILADQTQLMTLESQAKDAEKRLSELEDPRTYDDMIKLNKDRIAKISCKIEDLRLDLKSYRANQDLKQNQKNEIIQSFSEEESNLYKQYLDKKQQLDSEISTITAEIKQLESNIQKALAIKDVCPTCGHKLDNVFKPDVSKDQLLRDQLKDNLNLTTIRLSEVNSIYKAEKANFDKAKEEATADISKEILELNAHIQSIERSLASLQQDLDLENKSLSRCEQLKSSHDATVRTLTETIENNNRLAADIEKNSVYNNDLKIEYKSRIDAINKFTTITNRDFRGYLLKNVIDYIDNRAKDYCEDVFNTRLLDFILDGNNIDIRYCNKQYETLSGGEKQKLDLIIQFAIRDMLCQFLDLRCNVLAVDECFDALDVDGCDRLLDLFSKKFSDVSSFFIISHHTDLAIPSDSIITVTKGPDGVSIVA